MDCSKILFLNSRKHASIGSPVSITIGSESDYLGLFRCVICNQTWECRGLNWYEREIPREGEPSYCSTRCYWKAKPSAAGWGRKNYTKLFVSELEFQEHLEAKLTTLGVPYEREAKLSTGRIDFLIDKRIGVEMKDNSDGPAMAKAVGQILGYRLDVPTFLMLPSDVAPEPAWQTVLNRNAIPMINENTIHDHIANSAPC